MARLQIRMEDKPDGSSPNRKKGDIVTIMPDGWKYGTKEKYPTYMILEFPNVDPADLYHMMEPVLQDSILTDEAGNPKKEVSIRCSHYLDFDEFNFTESRQKKYEEGKVIRLSRSQIDKIFVRKANQ